jgi:8-oxo-dGTP diphosphatase
MVMASINVGVAVVRNESGHVLLAERTPRQIAAGFWELPGGKIEAGETPARAAARELAEETGIVANSLRPLITYDHAFPTKRVRLHIFDVTSWQGAPQGREGQRLAWADPAAPAVAPILPSNTRVLTALGLPPAMEIVELAGSASSLLARVRTALLSGARLIQLHGERLAPDQKVAIARRVCGMAREFGAKTLLAGSALEAGRAGADGLHSSASALRALPARPHALLWSVAVHDAQDLARAEALGADLAVMTLPDRGSPPVAESLPVYVIDQRGEACRAVRAGALQIAAAPALPPVQVPPSPSSTRRTLH